MDTGEIISKLKGKDLQDLSAVLGFDACIDNIFRIIRRKDSKNRTSYFNNSREFGEFLVEHENISCGIELETRLSKIGGNMVIMANALGTLGIKTHCIGTFGLPEILPVFRSMSPNCELYTVGETITASAMEFNDSKKIMFDPGPYNFLDWSDIKKRLGSDLIRKLFSGRNLISLVNWSEIAKSSEIWKGLIDEIIPYIDAEDYSPFVFVDFSDCSRKPHDEIINAISILAEFRKYFRVTVSMNQNEASVLTGVLGIDGNLPDSKFISKLYQSLGVDELVIHRTKDALAYNGNDLAVSETFFCSEPKILTGGGDNFNAGFCFAKFFGFSLFQCILVANSVSGFYVRYGKSPARDELAEFLRQST